MFSPSVKRIEFEMSRQADVTSKRLMIMRLKNVQVGEDQYFYKSSRLIWSTKTAEQTKKKGGSGCTYSFTRTKEDNETTLKMAWRIK